MWISSILEYSRSLLSLRHWPFSRFSRQVQTRPRGAVRREKRYAAETGYTYSYWSCGWQPGGDAAYDYAFDCRRDRGNGFRATVRLLRPSLDQCAAAMGREPTSAERYAMVKLAFFGAMDEMEELSGFQQPLVPTADEMIGFMKKLGRI